jgi:predicted nucleotide-binding protein
LELLFEFFEANSEWPTYRWLNQIAFVQHGIEFDAVYEQLPPGLVLPDPHRRITPVLPPENPISLTLAGLAALGRSAEIDVFIKVVRDLALRAANFVPPKGERGELSVMSVDVATDLAIDDGDLTLRLSKELIVNSLWEVWAGVSSGENGTWTISLVPERARRYKDVTSLKEIADVHTPVEAERQGWMRAVTPTADVADVEPGEAVVDDDLNEVPRRSVFVVHGRNDQARVAMFEFLNSLGLEPLTWEKLLATTGEASPYVGQVLSVGFRVAHAVVVVLTPDDEARLRAPLRGPREPAYETELTPQARPNVLFEAGMALSSHPTRTVLVELGQLRPFSDVAGRHTIRMNNSVEQRLALADRLRTAGCAVDLNGAWRDAGDFQAPVNESPAKTDSKDTNSRPAVRFALQAATTSTELGGDPITLCVQNSGPTDAFEAVVTAVHGARGALPPWYVRWRNSEGSQKEILTGHEWVLEVCQDAAADIDDAGSVGTWRFFQPEGEADLTPAILGQETNPYVATIRVTVKVTPRSDPKSALTNNLSLSLSSTGRSGVWDFWLVES